MQKRRKVPVKYTGKKSTDELRQAMALDSRVKIIIIKGREWKY